MGTRKQRHARKVKRALEDDVERAERLHREISDIFEELNGYQRYEDACAGMAIIMRDRSRDAREWLKANPNEYQRYRERANELRRARRPFRTEESIRAERARQKAWNRANKERAMAWLRRMRRDDPKRYAEWQRIRHQKDRARPGYHERARKVQRDYYARAKVSLPERYREILDRSKRSNQRRRERIKSDPELLELERKKNREYRRGRRARMTQAERERMRARERELYAAKRARLRAQAQAAE